MFPGSGARWPAPQAAALVRPQAGLRQGWEPGEAAPSSPQPQEPWHPHHPPSTPRPLTGPSRCWAPGPPASRDHSPSVPPYFGGGTPDLSCGLGPRHPHPERQHLGGVGQTRSRSGRGERDTVKNKPETATQRKRMCEHGRRTPGLHTAHTLPTGSPPSCSAGSLTHTSGAASGEPKLRHANGRHCLQVSKRHEAGPHGASTLKSVWTC